MNVVRTFIVGAFALLFLAGCGPRAATIKGTATFDGIPIEEGSISFLPEPGTESRKASAAILQGAFEVPAERGPMPGKFRIEISWVKKTGKKIASADPGMPDVDERIEAIPARYNTESTLVREITPGDNKLEFALER